MRYFGFYTRQKHVKTDEKRELDITVEAWTLKDAYALWNKRMERHRKDGWFVIGNYSFRFPS
jgi:hypothetical protein